MSASWAIIYHTHTTSIFKLVEIMAFKMFLNVCQISSKQVRAVWTCIGSQWIIPAVRFQKILLIRCLSTTLPSSSALLRVTSLVYLRRVFIFRLFSKRG